MEPLRMQSGGEPALIRMGRPSCSDADHAALSNPTQLLSIKGNSPTKTIGPMTRCKRFI